jgi:hypothetical protein
LRPGGRRLSGQLVPRVLPLLAVVAVMTTTDAAAAPPRLVRPVFSLGLGTSGCPDAARFEQVVERRLERPPFSEYAPTLLVVLIEREEGRGFVGRFYLRDEEGRTTGSRAMRLGNCVELVDAVALAVSILLDPPPATERGDVTAMLEEITPAPADPEGVLQPLPKPSAPESGALSTSVRASLPPVLQPSTPGPRRGWRPTAWQIGIGPTGDYDSSSTGDTDFTPGVAASVALLWGSTSLGLALRASLPKSQGLGRGEVRTQPFVNTALACQSALGFGVCGLFSAGFLRIEGQGFDDNRRTTRPYLAPGARLSYTFGTRWLRVRPHATVEVPLLRWAFSVDGGPALRPSPVNLALGIDLLAHFP